MFRSTGIRHPLRLGLPLTLLIFLGSQRNWALGTALDDYVAAPDPSYRFRLVEKVKGTTHTEYRLDLDSQTWRQASEVDRPLWSHRLFIIVPQEVKNSTAILSISGGNYGESPSVDPFELDLALKTQTVVASLRWVPCQPLEFSGDGQSRREDEILAYTFARYLDTGDATWPALLPMVKSAVRAMDAVQAFLGGEADPSVTVERFVVTGASKRGWTTWLTAAVDPRVAAIVPVVIDVLNIDEQMVHHLLAYKEVTRRIVEGYSTAVSDYVRENVLQRLGTTEGQALLQIVDPYEYRERLASPKYLVNGTGDQFFVPDSAQFYFHDLPGPKYLRYVPNKGHFGLAPGEVADGVQAFYEAVLSGKPLPRFSWTIEGEGSIRVDVVDPPLEVMMWQATNPANRDFRIDTFGARWTSSALADEGGGTYRSHAIGPVFGHTAYFVELKFPSGGPIPYTFTTEVSVFCDCPVLGFTAAPGTGAAPLAVAFDAAATKPPAGGRIASYRWDYGDGTSGEGAVASHEYDRPGRFISSLTIEDDRGRTASTAQRIDVLGRASDVSPWAAADIGEPAYPGAAGFEDGEGGLLTICAGGKDFGGQSDEGFFVYVERRGNFCLTARAAEPLSFNRRARLGAMLRESLDPGARFAAMTIERPADSAKYRFRALYREAAGASAGSTLGPELDAPSGWTRIEREGDRISFWISLDGKSWGAPVHGLTMPGLPEALLAGVAAAGGDFGDPSISSFEPLRACLSDLEVALDFGPFVRGDADGSGDLDITDAIALLNFLFLGGKAPRCLDAADSDDSGALDITDAVYTLSFLFLGGRGPKHPYPDCGVDEPIDDLDCREYPRCE